MTKFIPGVKDPTYGIVNELGLCEGLMTTFVGKNPNTGGDETGPEGVQRPEYKF